MEQEYLSVFLEESQEHLQALNENVLKLENNPEDLTVVGEIFRSAHTFKGMAATMGFTDLAHLTHEMENILDLIRNGKMKVFNEVIDVILECIDNLEKMVVDIQGGGTGALDVHDTVQKLLKLDNKQQESRESNGSKGQEDQNVFGEKNGVSPTHAISVVLNEDCILKGIRYVMVTEALNEIGDILETSPVQDVLESGDFDSKFSLSFVLKDEGADIESTVLRISEIHSVSVTLFNREDAQLTTPSKENPVNNTNVTVEKKTITKQQAAAKIENRTIRVNLDRIEALMNMFEETVIERGRIEEIVQTLDNKELEERVERLGSISKDLQNLVLKMRMVPVETVFNRFPRMVRGLAKDLGKEIELIIEGEDTEIDRIVIDEIGDPLVHLIRNSVDHGIEKIEDRLANGKIAKGVIKLEAFHSGNNVVIQITDDGNGINKKRVISKAINNGLISEADSLKLSDKEIFDLLFQSGFSTAEKISDISGRGVGLDVVKTTINKLGGTLFVTSEEGKGSTFRIELPLTLSIIQSMLVEANGNRYAVPLGNIVETMRISYKEVQDIQGKNVMNYRDNIIPIISLTELFHNQDWISRQENNLFQVVIVKTNEEKMYALSVDDILGQREIVLKSLGEFFKETSTYFSGATILGDGRVILILDCEKVRKV